MNRTEARHKLRRDALGRIKSERFKTSAALASALGDEFSPSYVSQLLSGHRGIGDDVATKIEERLGLPAGWMDEERMAAPQTCAHTDWIDAWEFLLSDEQATILADIKRRAAHNQSVLKQFSARRNPIASEKLSSPKNSELLEKPDSA